jgi:phage terminase large subunit
MPDRVFRVEPPNDKQKEFFQAKGRFIAYGGARGGGKSWAVRKKAALLALHYSGIRILLLRRTLAELRENHLLPLLQDLKDIAYYRELEKAFLFPNGSRLKFGYCDSENDVLQYQGQEYDVIFIDEATHFTEFQFNTLTACLRGANRYPKRMYLTCNPGGVGHGWVKRLFIDRDYRGSEHAEDYRFIPARVYDNKALLKQDSGYIKMLENLPYELREAWLNGNWNVFAGQYFREFDPDVHVVEPFSIPSHWRRYFAMDYGLDMLAGYWIAMDSHGHAYVYRELYQSGLIVSEAANRIRQGGTEEVYEYLAPPDMWNRRQESGKSIAELFWEHGIRLTRADNDRVQGWMAMKEWLKRYEDENGKRTANLQFFSTCPNLIRSLPLLQFDPKRPNDVATEPHELTHGPDAIRYFIAGRPASAAAVASKPIYNFESERPRPDVLRGERHVI